MGERQKRIEVVRVWQLPQTFFSLDLDAQWHALEAVTSPAVPLTEPRKPCPLSLADDCLAMGFFLVTLALPISIALAAVPLALGGCWPQLAWLGALVAVLALHPMPRKSVWGRSNRLIIALFRYFSFELLVDRNDPFQDGLMKLLGTRGADTEAFQRRNLPAIYLACPHGVFNYGAIMWCCISRWFTGWYQITGAAAAVTKVPGLRYMDLPIWMENPTRANIKEEMQRADRARRPAGSVRRPDAGEAGLSDRQRVGGMIGMVPDGILGAFRGRAGVDELVIGKKRGLMRIAAEEGATVWAAWFFGTTELLTVVQDPFRVMEGLSRKLKAGIMGFYGRWGLPVPRRVPLSLVVAPTKVAKVENPTKEQVDAVHDAVYLKGLCRVYEEQKAYAGYPNRTLVVS
jgi:hypothetical protein